ncbi:polysaccharide biosynthesis protein [Listeria booriae]|uniref:polysaccharide biosynthesis protein n=1 Tax=Listeria booriae TaxID=1552123 RepID=UPI0018060E30|nr:nucleoside-diphosphate sugar epimerase/dehydratase [Listeria booriae]MBC1358389.1 polysaccharide biosynthesis protein [Listeria booriae]
MTNKTKNNRKVAQQVLIIGAGVAGIIVAKQLKEQPANFTPIAFLDDDTNKQKQHIIDIPVVGSIAALDKVITTYPIDLVVLAIPSLNDVKKMQFIKKCRELQLNLRIITGVNDTMFQEQAHIDVTMEQLLGREPVKLDQHQVSEQIKGSTVLVTGAGGSIGSEICRQVCSLQPEMLILLGHGENSIYAIHMELRKAFGEQVRIQPVIADIQDANRINEIMTKYRPNVVYHAAAHKHVPLMEQNPREAVKNNVLGTRNVALAAAQNYVESFILVSSDKAVNPNNVMGATKRIAEMTVQMIATQTNSHFSIVRFGNVLGSRGSVIPLFKEQIRQGGPVTVTHPEMTRYFMTIPEAAGLVIQAGGLQQGSKIYVLDMGEPIKITTLAEKLITMSGFTLQEINIAFTGIRSGDKLYEELMNEGEMYPEQIIPKVHIGRPTTFSAECITHFIETFNQLDDEILVQTIYDLVAKKKVLSVKQSEVIPHENLIRS